MHICAYKVSKKITLVRDLSVALKGCAATIGNFDGVHLGHSFLIKHLVKKAKMLNLIPTLITFEPLPQRFFSSQPFLQLTSLSEKLHLLEAMGIEQVVCLRFNQTLATLSAADFVENILVKALDVNYLMVGEDFRFGHQRTGDILLLQQMAKQQGFVIESMALLKDCDAKMSSSLIRLALMQGDLSMVHKGLGRYFSVTHRVIHGGKRGRSLNLPTANLPLKRAGGIFKGVYVSKVYWNQQEYDAVANVGTRPTVDGKNYLVEVHILDFAEDLYGQRITVEFLHKLRDEKKFNHIEELKQQIHQDIQEARDFLKKTCPQLEYESYD